MSEDQTLAEEAMKRLYEAIELVMSGSGDQALKDAWHHLDHVTTAHPNGDWARGWDEVWATWEFLGSFGRPDRGGSYMDGLTVHVHGDFAYGTCIFHSSPTFGSVHLCCTNVMQKIDGIWKVVHHHIDKSPEIGAAFERLA